MTACAAVTSPTPTITDEPTREASPSPTPTNSASQSPTATITPSPEATITPSPTPDAPFADPETCTNDDLGYTVSYPGDWWANPRIEPGDTALTPIAACQYFALSPVELQPNAGLPGGLAVWFDVREGQTGTTGEILSREETTVDGRDAVVWELEPAPSPGFVPEGARVYQYLIDLDDGSQLVATTGTILQDAAAYPESKGVLDGMMETIEIEARG